jgi:hypothetical protein
MQSLWFDTGDLDKIRCLLIAAIIVFIITVTSCKESLPPIFNEAGPGRIALPVSTNTQPAKEGPLDHQFVLIVNQSRFGHLSNQISPEDGLVKTPMSPACQTCVCTC